MHYLNGKDLVTSLLEKSRKGALKEFHFNISGDHGQGAFRFVVRVLVFGSEEAGVVSDDDDRESVCSEGNGIGSEER